MHLSFSHLYNSSVSEPYFCSFSNACLYYLKNKSWSSAYFLIISFVSSSPMMDHSHENFIILLALLNFQESLTKFGSFEIAYIWVDFIWVLFLRSSLHQWKSLLHRSSNGYFWPVTKFVGFWYLLHVLWPTWSIYLLFTHWLSFTMHFSFLHPFHFPFFVTILPFFFFFWTIALSHLSFSWS